MDKKSGKEERRFPRITLPKGMEVAWQAGAHKEVSRVQSLGLGGLFITTPNPPPIGTILKLVFQVPNGEVRARATVRSTTPGEGMGIQFTGMDYDHRARLDLLLKRLLS
ncbi:MAG: PilZ domain-containing protein [Acidobacteriia bacterium]|nr:PilZ domain-containing protein [Terriglobia bacterium]